MRSEYTTGLVHRCFTFGFEEGGVLNKSRVEVARMAGGSLLVLYRSSSLSSKLMTWDPAPAPQRSMTSGLVSSFIVFVLDTLGFLLFDRSAGPACSAAGRLTRPLAGLRSPEGPVHDTARRCSAIEF